MTNKDIEIFCTLEKEEEKFLINAMQRLDLSTRVYFRTLKLARTIADLE
jgi:magnesium chelatase family protein